ncbi:hypothetical protein Purlil1_6947 [Purpureocillium lilacinum]|uniref:Uncharacterized protein n=1 Tax=Purpureocillium lilacinum TaxID=33203 RepID=A0ABR0BXE0_PURLI|nr:hypothetical protein Purlil1_6947 [Purpureocillium lilacinum]
MSVSRSVTATDAIMLIHPSSLGRVGWMDGWMNATPAHARRAEHLLARTVSANSAAMRCPAWTDPVHMCTSYVLLHSTRAPRRVKSRSSRSATLVILLGCHDDDGMETGARDQGRRHTHTHRHILRAYIRVHTHTYTTAAAALANCIQLVNLCRRQRNHGAPSVPLPPLADGRRRREHARTSHLLDSPSTIRTYACTSYYFPSCFVRVPYRNTRSTQSVHRRAGQSTVAPPQCQLAPRRNSSTARTGPNLHTTKIAAEAAARRRPVRLGPLPASDMVSGDIIGAERQTRCQPARPRLRWPLRSFYPRLCQSQLEARARCSAAYTSHSYFVTPS